jgi:hypothetical protein
MGIVQFEAGPRKINDTLHVTLRLRMNWHTRKLPGAVRNTCILEWLGLQSYMCDDFPNMSSLSNSVLISRQSRVPSLFARLCGLQVLVSHPCESD